MSMAMMTQSKYQTCIDECNRCAQACYECFKACLNEADVNARKNCISMLVECAQECEMFNDDHCKQCASECRTCAEECKKMSNM